MKGILISMIYNRVFILSIMIEGWIEDFEIKKKFGIEMNKNLFLNDCFKNCNI